MGLYFDYIFIPTGSAVYVEDGFLKYYDNQNRLNELPYGKTFVFDVGNHLGDGIIDHHQPGAPNQCAAAIVSDNPEKWIGEHIEYSDVYTLITHSNPDFDALGSVYLAEKYIRNRKLPRFAQYFADYIQQVDSGIKKLHQQNIVEPFSLILMISACITNLNKTLVDKNRLILNESYRLFDAIWNILIAKKTISSFDWESLEAFQKYIFLIKEDYAIYLDDLKIRSQKYQVKLRGKEEDSRLTSVDCLISFEPKSVLWKYWARGDKDNSFFQKGFILTAAFVASEKKRAIISVDPTSGYTLRGLGLYLDFLEMKKILNDTPLKEIIGEKRPGFHRKNPWYDGRSGLHDFTIIDAPFGGSSLSEKKIIKAILDTETWNRNLPCDNFKKITAEDILNHFTLGHEPGASQ